MLKRSYLATVIGCVVAGVALSAQGQSLDLSKYSPQCKIQVLQKLGWQVQPGGAFKAQVSGDACSVDTLANVRAQNILTLQSPENAADGDLDTVLKSTASLCGYKFSYNAALTKATHGLNGNLWYSFDMKFISDDTIRLGGVKGWQKVACASDNVPSEDHDSCYQPAAGQTEQAFSSLYRASYASECDTGLQLAEFSAIHELFGARTSNYFTPNELFIGNWYNVKQSKSVTHGQNGRRVNDPRAVFYSTEGYQILTGVPGYIGSTIADESLLDDKTNRNENFIVVKTSPQGMAELKKHGGLRYYNFVMKQIWQDSHRFNRQQLNMIAHHHQLPEGSPDAHTIIEAMNDPFLRDTILYIKGLGFTPIADVVVRLTVVNPRMPYGIAFDAEATHAEIFDRWLAAQLDQCAQ